MKRDSVVAIVRALNEMEVQYLIVGGLAVVAHGYVCFKCRNSKPVVKQGGIRRISGG